jgi:protein-tyrosine phosphatase
MAYRITCVCLGNICRSPIAEVVIRDRLETAGLTSAVIDSAGTGHWHVGRDADPRTRRALESVGYRFSHSARQFAAEWLDRTDLVLAMDLMNLADLHRLAATRGSDPDRIQLLRSFDPEAPPGAEVPDPYYGGPSGFAEVLAMVERCADGVVAHVRTALAA